MSTSKHAPTSSLVAAAFAATIAIAVAPSSASAVISVRGSCDHHKGTRLMQSRQAKVLRLGGSLLACAPGRNRLYGMTAGACFPRSSCGVRQIAISGPYVAYMTFAHGQDLTTRTVMTLDPRSGTLRAGVASDPAQPSTRDGSVTDLVVSQTGQVAWIYRTARPSPSYEVHVGASIVDRSATVTPGSLAIAGSTAYWMRDGAAQSAMGTPLATVPR